MTIIVEDGTGRADAESFCTVAFADTYHAARGNEAWDNVDNKEASLRQACDYMQQTYRLRWAGYRVTDFQALDWPRYEVPRQDSSSYAGNLGRFGGYASYYPADEVPVEVQRANAELALKSASGELLEDREQAVKSETVGPLQVVYQDHSSSVKRFLTIDRLLAPFLQGGGNIKLSRG